MKHFLPFILPVAFALSATGIHAQTTPARPMLSLLTRHYLANASSGDEDFQPVDGIAYKEDASGRKYLSAIIKVSSAKTADSALQSIGSIVGTRAGVIWTLRVPVHAVTAFTTLPGIAYIQLDEPAMQPKLNLVRIDTHVDSVQAGLDLPMAYTGKGVVLGVIDFGFDYNHPAFYDTSGKRYRIRRVWEQGGTGTAPSGYAYGREITDSNTMRTAGTDNSKQTHGTSTASIAAGSGFGSKANNNSLYRGMAPDADVVLVGVRRESIGPQWMNGSFTDFIDGISYIFRYADSVKKPAAINISWGSQSGPHDGSTLFNQACDNLSAKGKIVVMSAGNEGQEKLHLTKTFSAGDTSVSTFLKFTSPAYKRTWVDIWGDPGKTFCAKTTLYRGAMIAGNTTGRLCLDNGLHTMNLIASNGIDTCYIEYINTTADLNGKPHMLINIWNKSSDSVGIVLTASSGKINAWDEYYYYGYTYGYQSFFDNLSVPGAVSGDVDMTVSDMGSAQTVLMVGAHNTRTNWTSVNGSGYYIPGAYIDQIAKFSSHGPLADGRIKPDISAPGQMVLTAVNSMDTAYRPAGTSVAFLVDSFVASGGKVFYYGAFSGTSASSPVAAGIVALMLQANPTLTPQKVKSCIFQSATQDYATDTIGLAGNNTWGHGKINAAGAVRLALQQTGVYHFEGARLDCALYPNPNNGAFTLEYAGSKQESLHMRIADATGRMIMTESWTVNAGINRRELRRNVLSKGLYVVSIYGNEGSVSIRMIVD